MNQAGKIRKILYSQLDEDGTNRYIYTVGQKVRVDGDQVTISKFVMARAPETGNTLVRIYITNGEESWAWFDLVNYKVKIEYDNGFNKG